jgi:hypothetical protein
VRLGPDVVTREETHLLSLSRLAASKTSAGLNPQAAACEELRTTVSVRLRPFDFAWYRA